jgi:hypothetical protein
MPLDPRSVVALTQEHRPQKGLVDGTGRSGTILYAAPVAPRDIVEDRTRGAFDAELSDGRLLDDVL